MSVDPIYRVRRLALAALICEGGQPSAAQFRRAALEPFDDRVPFNYQTATLRSAADRGDAPNGRRRPGPTF